VQLVCRAIGQQLLDAAAKMDGRPLGDAKLDDVVFEDGVIKVAAEPARSVRISDVMSAAKLSVIEAEETAKSGWADAISQIRKSRNTHAAIFAEVKVDDELRVVRVTRVVIAVAAGRIINPKTARSQILGGVVMGLGMALYEETLMDTRFGRFMNHNFAEYHVAAHADVVDIEVIFVDEPDPEVTPLGVKGLGEIGIVGTAAAIANAIYHATGKRVRSLPITIDKLL